MSKITIKKVSIVDLTTDAIVNAANNGLMSGGGVCGAIFKAAGHKELYAACNNIGHCDTGSAVITPGFNLKAKYIIHAVGPRYRDGTHGERELLYSAYQASLKLAVDNGCKSIGFPLISAGIYGYPKDDAWRVALQSCGDFISSNSNVSIKIVFAVLDDDLLKLGNKIFTYVFPGVKVAEKSDWKTEEMPEEHAVFLLKRSFTEEQMNNLRHGNIPAAMEDKWFWYMDGDTLYAHRSWTGFCVYIIEFSNNGTHKVTVNRNPEQYKCTSLEEDAEALNKLLCWWSGAPYDYYHEWLSETADSFIKQVLIKNTLQIDGNIHEAIFFHKPEEPHGYLSNWYLSEFTVDGIKFTSAEQYIMYQKCIVFGDTASAEAILATQDVAKQQSIGRKASGYNKKIWSGMRQVIAYRGLFAKFSQNKDLLAKLLETDDAYLVECAVSDKIWACGISLKDMAHHDISLWKGQNILGFALMEVRKQLKNNQE